MRYVLDSSVALKWVLPEVDSAKAIRLRDEYRNGLHELLATDRSLVHLWPFLPPVFLHGHLLT
jgi:hypothetical protein